MKAAAQPIAYSYIRFSTDEQRKGDSLRRQTEAAAEWCQRNGVALDTTTKYHDLGKSAFLGEHRKNPDRHKLAAFLELAKSGKIPEGSFLLIENLDRLSREHSRPALTLFMQILDLHISIVQLHPETIFRHESHDPFDLMRAILELSRGHSESAAKSKRIGAAWAEKKRQARAGKHILTHRLPAWITEEAGALRVIPDRGDVVRRIYQLAADGYGLTQIVRQFTTERVPTIGRTGKWSRSYVARILTDRRPLGEFQPCDRRGKPDGAPIANYFPAVVTEHDWLRARGGLMQRRRHKGRTGEHINLFAGLLHDARDGGTFFTAKGGDPARPDYRVFINTAFRNGDNVKCRSFPEEVFEGAVRSLLREVDPREVLGQEEDAPREVRALAVEVDQLRMQKAVLEDELLKGDVPSIAAAIRKINAKEVEVEAKLTEARQRAAHPLSGAWTDTQTLADIPGIDDDPDKRLRLRAALRRTIEDIRVLIVPRGRDRLAAVQMWFAGGAKHRDFLILHRPAKANARARVEGRWWAIALPFAAGKDLRKKKDARELEPLLANLDLATITDDNRD